MAQGGILAAPITAVLYAAAQSLMTPIWSSATVLSAMAITNIARTICLHTPMSSKQAYRAACGTIIYERSE